MNFNEAVALFDNNRRKMAETLGVSQPAVQYWSKTGTIPKLRQFQIEVLLKTKGE